MSSSVEREEEGRGATDFFRMGLGRLEDRERDKVKVHKMKTKMKQRRIATKENYPANRKKPSYKSGNNLL